VVQWDAVKAATGYCVLRANAATGPFTIVADLEVTTGAATAAADVVNVWSQAHSYIPADGALAAPDASPWFQYVDVGPGQRWFRVVAYNTAGEASASAVVSASPP
jgi:hypothetical protein